MSKRTFAIALSFCFSIPIAAAGCEGPSVPSSVKGELICKDFKQAGETLKGTLRYPVRLRILDGNKVIVTVMLYGLPESSSKPTRFLMPDTNDKYTLEWAQCKNERAPTPFDPRDKAAQKAAGGTTGSYDCGEVSVYDTGEQTTKRGDPSTHEIEMIQPPDTTCWQ